MQRANISIVKRRLADEYDAAQERGEVSARGQRNDFLPEGEKVPTIGDIDGLTHKDIHEARVIRDAEVADPGKAGLAAPTAPCKRLPAWGAEADARFLWPQRRWPYRPGPAGHRHCRRWSLRSCGARGRCDQPTAEIVPRRRIGKSAKDNPATL